MHACNGVFWHFRRRKHGFTEYRNGNTRICFFKFGRLCVILLFQASRSSPKLSCNHPFGTLGIPGSCSYSLFIKAALFNSISALFSPSWYQNIILFERRKPRSYTQWWKDLYSSLLTNPANMKQYFRSNRGGLYSLLLPQKLFLWASSTI